MFFIVGSARSGTTLLRTMLNTHTEVAVPPESRFIVELYQGADDVVVDDFLRSLQEHKRWRTWDLPIESVAAELEGAAHASYAGALEACYQAFAHSRKKKVYGDKTPRYVEHMDFLHRLWPEARFVHVVRDGREVALSYADVPFGPKTVARAARLWARRVNRGISAGRALPGGLYHELRYERLVDHAEASARDLTTFLGIEFDPAMLEPGRRAGGEVLARASMYNPHVTGKITRTRSWSEQMPKSQIEMFEAVAGDTLDALGYERRFPRPSPAARLSAGLGLAGAPIGRLKPTPKVSSSP